MMRRRRYLLILLLFVVFIIEGTIIPWIVPPAWQTRIIPHLVYIIIIFIAVYDNRHLALTLAISFGLLQDVVYYGALIGAYSFAMAFSIYFISLIFRSGRTPLPLMMIAVIIGSLALDSILYWVYRLFEVYHQTYDWAMTSYMIPNLVVHFIFALAVYVPLRRQLESGYRRSKEESA